MYTESNTGCGGAGNYVASFDLDRTLTGNNSGREIIRMAVRKGVLSYSVIIRAFVLSMAHRLNLRNTRETISNMALWAKGQPEDLLQDLCREAAIAGIIPSIYPGAKQEIEYHRKEKAQLVLLSSALAPVCRQVALHLGLDSVICSELEVAGGFFTGKSKGRFCYGEEKARKLLSYCEINHYSPSSAWYYGDSYSDLPVLELVGNPVCVNPDKRLLALARKKGWQIRKWTASPSGK